MASTVMDNFANQLLLSADEGMNLFNRPVTIGRRNDFFTDNFLRGSRVALDKVFKDYLVEDTSSSDDAFSSYRKLRERHLKGDDKAAVVEEDQNEIKIVMDVKGFNHEDLSVKVFPREVLVSGLQEKKVEGSSSSYSKRSIQRRFELPATADVEDTTANLAEDGVLEIKVSKKKLQITNDDNTSKTTNASSTSKSSSKVEQSSTTETVQQTQSKNQQQQEQQSSSEFIKEKKYSIPSAPKSIASRILDELGSCRIEKEFDDFSSDRMRLSPMPIVSRDQFWKDSAFDNVRQDFQNRVNEMVSSKKSSQDRFNSSKWTDEETQASSVTENGKEYKVVIDVLGLTEKDIKISFKNNNTLVIEGKAEKSSSNSYCSQSFHRSFLLPSTVDLNKASSVLSCDGILTVTIVKKLAIGSSQDHVVPVVRSNETNAALEAKANSSSVTTESSVTESTQTSTQQQSLNESVNVGQDDVKRMNFNTFTTEHVIPSEEKKEEKRMNFSTFTTEHKVPIVMEDDRSTVTSKVVTDMEKIIQSAADDLSNLNTVSEGNTQQEQTKITVTQESTGSVKVAPQEVREEKKMTYSNFVTEHVVPIELENDEQSAVSQSMQKVQATVTEETSKRDYVVPIDVENPIPTVQSPDCCASICSDISSIPEAFVVETEKNLAASAKQTREEPLKSAVKVESTVTTTSNTKQSTPISAGTTCSQTKDSQQKVTATQTQETSSTKATSNQSQQKESCDRKKDSFSDMRSMIPVNMRGSIYSDSYFDDIVQNFDKRVEDSLKRFNTRSSIFDTESKTAKQEVQQKQEAQQKQEVQKKSETTRTEVQQKLDVQQKSGQMDSSLVEDKENYKIVCDIFGYEEGEVNVKVENENTITVSGQYETKSGGSITRHRFQRAIQIPGPSRISEAKADISKEGLLTITVPKIIKESIASSQQSQTQTSSSEELANRLQDRRSLFDRDFFSSFDDERDALKSRMSRSVVPISARGRFFDDSFFSDDRQMFQQSLDRATKRFRSFATLDKMQDQFGVLDSFRENKYKGANQMTSLEEGSGSHRIVLDVHDFDLEKLQVKVSESGELIIEGQSDEKTPGCSSAMKFRKTFVLPGNVDFNKASSAISEDKILTVTVPKV